MASTELGGTVTFQVNGVQYSLRGKCMVNIGGAVRTSVMDTNGNFVGTTTKYEPGKIEIEVNDSSSTSIAAVRAVSGGTVYAQLANGKNYIGTNMSQVGAGPDLDVIEGKFDVTFEGSPLQEILG